MSPFSTRSAEERWFLARRLRFAIQASGVIMRLNSVMLARLIGRWVLLGAFELALVIFLWSITILVVSLAKLLESWHEEWLHTLKTVTWLISVSGLLVITSHHVLVMMAKVSHLWRHHAHHIWVHEWRVESLSWVLGEMFTAMMRRIHKVIRVFETASAFLLSGLAHTLALGSLSWSLSLNRTLLFLARILHIFLHLLIWTIVYRFIILTRLIRIFFLDILVNYNIVGDVVNVVCSISVRILTEWHHIAHSWFAVTICFKKWLIWRDCHLIICEIIFLLN